MINGAKLIALGFIALGMLTSLFGVLIAGVIAAIAGTCAGALAEPERTGRTVAMVVGYIAILTVAYMLMGQMAAPYVPPGARGGPGVMPPP